MTSTDNSSFELFVASIFVFLKVNVDFHFNFLILFYRM
ncbi:hypothetical protein LEP1GSC043_4715 [Leptospira weilii str. Ecochallenge]|uniref:Uncharacterized protein n=1 Tax=Leptospira weilii str. Ecochallenge TaxID=1049986 RepID=N1U4I2_9LEPT|nr:hypothetical protein LEP1GSC043_4715 [Leptospira weilii str. Ecochallenge]